MNEIQVVYAPPRKTLTIFGETDDVVSNSLRVVEPTAGYRLVKKTRRQPNNLFFDPTCYLSSTKPT